MQASLCMKNLDGAADNVADEIRKLDEAGERCVEASVKAFQEVAAAVDRRRDDVIATVRRIRDDKKRVLREQLDIIESERRRVRADCDGLQASCFLLLTYMLACSRRLSFCDHLFCFLSERLLCFVRYHLYSGSEKRTQILLFLKVTFAAFALVINVYMT